MKNPICISTVCMHRLFKDRNDRIRALRKFSPAGIEISFGRPKYLFDFDISKENWEYLRTLKFNSIHAPSREEKGDDKKVLAKISELYRKINARNVVFHKDSMKNFDLVANTDFITSLENDDWRKSNNDIRYFKKLLDNNKKFKFTMDIAHVFSTSSDITEYIDCFKDRLIEVHLSIIIKDSSGQYLNHAFLHQNDNRETRKLLQCLKKVSAPLVLECFVPSLKEINLLKKEIENIKKNLALD